MAERKQISMWISAESAALLQRLADEQSQPKNKIIELALAAYSTGEPTSNDTSDLLDWRTDLNSRVLALETRLQVLEAVGAVRVGAVGKEAQSADLEAVGVIIKTVGAKPAIDRSVVKEADMPTGATPKPADDAAAEKKKSLSNAELDVIVRDYLKRADNKIITAGELMRQDGISFSQKRLIESRDRIKSADRIIGR